MSHRKDLIIREVETLERDLLLAKQALDRTKRLVEGLEVPTVVSINELLLDSCKFALSVLDGIYAPPLDAEPLQAFESGMEALRIAVHTAGEKAIPPRKYLVYYECFHTGTPMEVAQSGVHWEEVRHDPKAESACTHCGSKVVPYRSGGLLPHDLR